MTRRLNCHNNPLLQNGQIPFAFSSLVRFGKLILLLPQRTDVLSSFSSFDHWRTITVNLINLFESQFLKTNFVGKSANMLLGLVKGTTRNSFMTDHALRSRILWVYLQFKSRAIYQQHALFKYIEGVFINKLDIYFSLWTNELSFNGIE